jgi:hypothetical protein
VPFFAGADDFSGAAMIEAYPLHWPPSHERTPACARDIARFDTTMARARDALIREIKIMTGTQRYGDAKIIISTNVPLRNDGLPKANRSEPNDPGVAVYFMDHGKQKCFPCDRWTSIADNMQAIAKTLDALRGIERWGSRELHNAAYAGFDALPAPTQIRPWWQVLGVYAHTSTAEVEAAYRVKRSEAHPDRGGSLEAFHATRLAWAQFKEERGLA